VLQNYELHILDFTGFSVFRELLNTQIKDCNFICYIYDSSNLETIKLWKETIKEIGVKNECVEYLVGNRPDLESKIAVVETSTKI
jgi:GTPase SAR1 family protein